MYYKLIDMIDQPKTLSVVVRSGSSISYGHIRLDPGRKYEIPEDEVLLKSLKDATETVRYTPEKEDALKRSGASYEKKLCQSCGGRVVKLVYHVVEVVDDGKA